MASALGLVPAVPAVHVTCCHMVLCMASAVHVVHAVLLVCHSAFQQNT